jgi:hypothetical protein
MLHQLEPFLNSVPIADCEPEIVANNTAGQFDARGAAGRAFIEVTITTAAR